jgi:hypothetical protein
MREAHVELTLGRRPLRIWVLVADITDELILDWMSCGISKRRWTWDAACCG